MVTQPGLHDKDLVLWTQLLAESLNTAMLAALRDRGHPELRYSHGFLIQQLVEGPRPVGGIAENLGVTSQAVSKTVRELEARYRANGVKDVKTRYYTGARHELLNETNRDEVHADLVEWLDSHSS